MNKEDLLGLSGETFKLRLSKDYFEGEIILVSDLERLLTTMSKYSDSALLDAIMNDKPVPILTIPKSGNIADLMQANPNLSKEELLYWCPEFKDEEFSSWDEESTIPLSQSVKEYEVG